MKKIILTFFLLQIIFGCSFDNKSRIWTGTEIVEKKNTKNNLKPVFKEKSNNLPIKSLISKENLQLGNVKNYKNWKERYLNNLNNIGNLEYDNNGKLQKLSKISRHAVNKNFLIDDDNLIFSDTKGNVGVYSLSENRHLFNYNFYKKKLKKIDKNIKLLVRNKTIIVADNLGYLYALDYKNNKLKWAKNFLVPFRSNIKIVDNILFLADEKNKIILIDFKSGEKIDELYTKPAKIVSEFESNLAIDQNKYLYFLSTAGNLYSLDLINKKVIRWVINLNINNDVSFSSKPIIIKNDKILVTSKSTIFLYSNYGEKIWEKNIESNTKPIISGDMIFLVNKNNFLVVINLMTGKVVFSDKVSSIISRSFDKKFNKKIKSIEEILIFNNKLLLISDNSYFVELNINKNIAINSIMKKPFDIGSDIILVNKKIIIIGNNKKIYSNF